jgi:hypothetical protein
MCVDEARQDRGRGPGDDLTAIGRCGGCRLDGDDAVSLDEDEGAFRPEPLAIERAIGTKSQHA